MPPPIDVAPGDCIESIAYKKRLQPDLIWDDPANAQLKKDRKDRNVLLHGTDKVVIPDPVPKWDPNKKTGQTHIFQLKLPTKKFKFQLVTDRPRTNLTCTVKVDGKPVPAVIDNDWLVCEIIPDSKEAVITVTYPRAEAGNGIPFTELVYNVALGHLRPVDTDDGIRDRLTNLGFFCNLPDNTPPSLPEAIERFQNSYAIDPTAADARQQMIEKLRELTGDPA